jgi:serine phosphatase RsbU (regulator of sigma subunit)
MAQRQLARAEHRIAAELQRVVMPWWHRPVALPGLDVATRYFPAEALARVGGDWYDGLTLPDGSVLFALGDMSGHGLTAASGMTTLRGALEGIAMTGASPGSILYWLNRLMVHTLSDEAVASVVCCRFDPLSRVLTWAQAGHPTPLLFREGTGVLLDPPEGVLLGADREPVFGESRVELRPGDVMLMYTDGLVERRGQDVDASVQPLLDLAPRLRGADARTCVDLVVSRLGHTDYEDDACVMAVRVTGG